MKGDSKKFILEGGGDLFLTLGKKTGKRKLFWDNYKSNEQKPGVQKVAHFLTISRKIIIVTDFAKRGGNLRRDSPPIKTQGFYDTFEKYDRMK